MRGHHFTVVVLAGFVFAGAACSKGGAKGGGGGSGAAAAADFESKAMEFKYRQFADGRNMLFKLQAKVPKGWKLMTEGSSLESMNTFMPGDAGPGANVFATSSLTISSTCHGQCSADKMAEQVVAVGKSRLEMQGTGAKLVRDEEVKPGVRVFVVQFPGAKEGETNYNVGVTHWAADRDYAVFCEALLLGREAALWQPILDACTSLEIAVVDPLVSEERAKQEEANLAKCPAASSVKHTPKEAKPEDPQFTAAPAVFAEATQPGSVFIYLASVPLSGRDEFRNKELQPGQGIVDLSLMYSGEGEVLSGRYEATGEGPLRADAGLRVTGGVTLQFVTNPECYIEVIARTPKKICGRFAFQDEWRSLSGEFVADLTPAR